MFSFFKKKPAAEAPATAPAEPAPSADDRWWNKAVGKLTGRAPAPSAAAAEASPAATPAVAADDDPAAALAGLSEAELEAAALAALVEDEAEAAPPMPAAPASTSLRAASPAAAPAGLGSEPAWQAPGARVAPTPQTESAAQAAAVAVATPAPASVPASPPAPPEAAPRAGWVSRLKHGLRKTGASFTQVFTGARIDEALYEELEAALLMADAGPKATAHLLADLQRRVKEARATEAGQVKTLLAQALADLLAPLERGLEIGRHLPTVIMVAGVNGAGKTTTIGKLTRHLAAANQHVLLAAGDTFRAAAREQLAVWAERNDRFDTQYRLGRVEILAQEGADPAAVGFDAVAAGRARGFDVVVVDTAGRLPTQLHLMDELKKIRRVLDKAEPGAPHEVLLVVDGNTGQNALAQVKAFDQALGLTGLVVTKLDGTAKGGVLAAIALWASERGQPLPVYFIGVGEKLEDLQTFDAREFAQALLESP